MYYILYILYVLYIIHINLYYMLYVLGYYPSTYEDTIPVHSILVHIKPLTFDWRQTFSNGSIPAHIKPLQKGLLSTCVPRTATTRVTFEHMRGKASTTFEHMRGKARGKASLKGTFEHMRASHSHHQYNV